MTKTNLYSIVRFCPDAVRGEYVNIGVALFTANDHPCVRVKLAKSVRAVLDLLPKGDRARFDQDWYAFARESFAARLRENQDLLCTHDDFRSFVQRRQGEFQMSDARAVISADHPLTLQHLYEKLVRVRRSSKQASRSLKHLHAGIKLLREQGLQIRTNTHIEIPNLGRFLIPYEYQNGSKNLIRTMVVTGDQRDGLEAAKIWGFAEPLHDAAVNSGTKIMVAAGSAGTPSAGDAERHLEKFFEDRGVSFFASDQVDDLLRKIENEAHR